MNRFISYSKVNKNTKDGILAVTPDQPIDPREVQQHLVSATANTDLSAKPVRLGSWNGFN